MTNNSSPKIDRLYDGLYLEEEVSYRHSSDINIYLKTLMQERQQAEAYQLYAANGSTITTYG